MAFSSLSLDAANWSTRVEETRCRDEVDEDHHNAQNEFRCIIRRLGACRVPLRRMRTPSAGRARRTRAFGMAPTTSAPRAAPDWRVDIHGPEPHEYGNERHYELSRIQ